MPTPHKHAEFIKAWADGQEVQVLTNSGWVDVAKSPSWLYYNQYRIKPAAPKWPQTTIPADKMWDLHRNDPTHCDLWKFANGVIEHECSTGALVPADKANENALEHYQRGLKEGATKEWERNKEIFRTFYATQVDK